MKYNSENEGDDLKFPNPDNFESYDDVDSAEGQSELPLDSYDEKAVSDDEEGCGCIR